MLEGIAYVGVIVFGDRVEVPIAFSTVRGCVAVQEMSITGTEESSIVVFRAFGEDNTRQNSTPSKQKTGFL